MTVRGVGPLATSLRQSADALRDEEALADVGAEIVADEAKPRTPKRTGALMATVRTDAGRVVAGSTTVVYAGTVHWGSPRRHIRAQPWIAEAGRRAEGRVEAAIRGQVVEIVERIEGQ